VTAAHTGRDTRSNEPLPPQISPHLAQRREPQRLPGVVNDTRTEGIEVGHERRVEPFPALDQLQGARAGTLSGGEQQMLAMGRGLLGGTEMLLLDEPTEGLAPKIVADVRDAITRLADELTVVLVEQNLDLALSVADSVVVLANGELVHRADADELSPNDKVLREYISI
jgi:branched-chain amino acid transport system ATP-binding protein